jgi:hypothetical protein
MGAAPNNHNFACDKACNLIYGHGMVFLQPSTTPIAQTTSRGNLTFESVNDQGSALLNEDHLLIGTHTFGVFDGASSLTPGRFHGMTGAWWASFLAWSVFAHEKEMSLTETARQANMKIRQAMIAHNVPCDQKLECWSTSAAVFRVKNQRLEWVQIGDSLVGVIHENGHAELLTPYHNHDRETLDHMSRLAAQGVDNVCQAAMPVIKKVRQGMNKEYGVLNGEQAALDFLHAGVVPARGIRHVIALTDGMFPPSQDPGTRFDFTAFASQFREQGLTGILQDIRAREQADPQCRLFPRFKQHDDATAVAVTLGKS